MISYVMIGLLALAGQPSQACASQDRSQDRSEVLNIGCQKQLFADNYIISELDNVYRVMNRPLKYHGNPLLELNPNQKPGAKELIVVSGSVLYDKEQGLFKMWYEGANYEWSHNVVCYATSKDGIHWDLPNLGLIEYNGSKENNIVFEKGVGEMAPGVMKDPVAKDPQRKYKMIYKRAGRGWPLQGINTASSPDGIHWTIWTRDDVIAISDSPNSVLWDAKLGKYVAHTRGWEGGKKTRVILQSESDDFVKWSKPRVILRPDNKDPKGARQFYNMEWMPYEGVYFGFLSVYHDREKGPNWDKVDVRLTYSRDGRHWQQLGKRHPFIPNGTEPGMVDWGQIYVMQHPLIVGDEIWIYYVGFKGLHWATQRKQLQSSSVNLCKLPVDRFVALEPGGAGIMTTKPFLMNGDQLVLNVNAAHASLKVEILDAMRKPLEGFSRDDCIAVTGNCIRHVVQWKSGQDVSALKNRPIRLRFYLEQCKLYSFVFVQPRESEAADR